MSFEGKIQAIQSRLVQNGLDGWLLYDFHGLNPFVHELLEIPPENVLTRRFFYWIPKQGEPVKILHTIESQNLMQLPGKTGIYLSWKELEENLQKLLRGMSKIAMEYSPRNSNPYVSIVDAGTIELIRSFGIEVVSSADLLQYFTTVLSDDQIVSHREAAAILLQTVDRAWDLITDRLREGKKITEYDVQQFILSEFLAHDCITEDGPICAVNGHSALPHYAASRLHSHEIQKGDFILIDLWCKKSTPGAVYADITRVAVAAPEATPRQEEVFEVVKEAMEKAFSLIEERMSEGKPLRGAEVDQVCRNFIAEKGFGAFFPHRTGHNIGARVHGAGAHLDNLETVDNRLLIPGTCFSIEPGIYLPGEFGVRIESDVLLYPGGRMEITGGKEESILCLLS